MTIKRILIFAPIVITLFLLQSYFWVPTYEQETKGNPNRLREYIDSSTGDASFLNPILSSDSASSQIESKVFEGLLDRDEELRFRGRLATSWEISEVAYFRVNKFAPLPGMGPAGAKEAVTLIKRAKEKKLITDPGLASSLANIKEISVLSTEEFERTFRERATGKKDAGKEIKITVNAPPRVKMTLNKVDQDLFKNLEKILGKEYFASFRGEEFIKTKPSVQNKKRQEYAKKFLPAVEHNPVIVFSLRPNVKFHDGHIFDAHDVKFTYQAIMNPKNLSPRGADYEPIKAVEVVDPLTVKVIYKRLYSPALGTWGMGILPEHLLNTASLREEAKKKGEDPSSYSIRKSSFNRNPVGCGPFVFKEWKSDQYITLERFEDYWETPPNYHKFVFRIIPDLLTQEMEFYAGTVDNYGVQPHQVKRLKTDPRFQSFSGPQLGYTFIGYNMRRKPFDDPRVRKALGMAIDVNKIIDYVLYGQGEPITGPFVKQTDYYNHNINPLPYDPDGALRLLEQSGWKKNGEGWLEKGGKRFQFTLITNNGNDLRKAILAIAQDSWKQIGIDVRTDLLEWSVFIQERVDKSDFDAIILGWLMGIEPDLYQIWHSSQTNPHQLNFVAFKDKEADDLIIRIRQEYDHKKQVELCHKLHEIIAREQPYTFLYVGKWTAILDKRIMIKEMGDDGSVRYEKIKPTKTGTFTFYFNKWIRVKEMPVLNSDG